jgi:hypothetical protein
MENGGGIAESRDSGDSVKFSQIRLIHLNSVLSQEPKGYSWLTCP